MMGYQMIEKF